MKRIPWILTLGLAINILAFGNTACAGKMPSKIVTPQGQAAYRADLVVQRLGEFSGVVRSATGTQPGNIAPKDAFTLIEWVSGDTMKNTTGVVQIVQAAAQNDQSWKPLALQTYTQRVRPLLLKYPQLATWEPIITSLLEVL